MALDLQSMIERYLAAADTRSINSLSKRSGVPPTSVRRICSGEVERSDFGNILKILNVVASLSEAQAFLSERFPNEAKIILAQYKLNHIASNTDEALEAALKSPRSFVVMSLAGPPNGTTRQDAVKIIGERASSDIDDLIDKNLLKEEHGRLLASKEHCAPSSLDIHVDMLRHVLRFWTRKKRGFRVRSLACTQAVPTSKV